MSTSSYWDSLYHSDNTPWRGVSPWLKDMLASHDVPRGAALDLGCGTGENSRFLAEQGFSVTGIDISPAAIKMAEAASKALPCTFSIGDLADPAVLEPFENHSFNLALDLLTTQFLTGAQQQRLLQRIDRLLNSDGIYLHSRVFARSDDAPEWVKKISLSPKEFIDTASMFSIMDHTVRPSSNLRDTEVHSFVFTR